MALTEKQELFVIYYVETLNATEAYSRAYPNVKRRTAEVNGHKLLSNTEIRQSIDEKLDEMKSEKIADAEEVLEFLTGMMRNKKVYPKDRIHSAELLGKRYSLWTERLEIDGTMDVEINLTGFNQEDQE